jgi:hypothetical protein
VGLRAPESGSSGGAEKPAVCLTQLERADDESRAAFAAALRRIRLERAASRIADRYELDTSMVPAAALA